MHGVRDLRSLGQVDCFGSGVPVGKVGLAFTHLCKYPGSQEQKVHPEGQSTLVPNNHNMHFQNLHYKYYFPNTKYTTTNTIFQIPGTTRVYEQDRGVSSDPKNAHEPVSECFRQNGRKEWKTWRRELLFVP